MATAYLALERGEPLNEAIYCEVMFDKEISGEIPEHRDFIYEVGIPYLERNGVKVTVLRSEMTFIDSFYRVLKKGKNAGKLNAWPLCGRCCIQRDCKLPPINAYLGSLGKPVVQYIGIAGDERKRLSRLMEGKTVSLLEKYGKRGADAVDICKRARLYSPIYSFTNRGGCFFCPNAKRRELRHLYDCHPDLWSRLLECQRAENKVTDMFNRDERFDEIDEEFRWQDRQFSLFGSEDAQRAA